MILIKTITDLGVKRQNRPIKVMQYGEGNFLRAFADYVIDILNEKTLGKIVEDICYNNAKRYFDI